MLGVGAGGGGLDVEKPVVCDEGLELQPGLGGAVIRVRQGGPAPAQVLPCTHTLVQGRAALNAETAQETQAVGKTAQGRKGHCTFHMAPYGAQL